MSDTTSDTDKTLRAGLGRRKPLSLKRETDTVRQSFSGGRSKAVVVETTKRRHILKPGAKSEPGAKAEPGADVFRTPEPAPVAAAPAAAPAAPAAVPAPAAAAPAATRPVQLAEPRAAAPQAPTSAPPASARPRPRTGGGMVLKALTDDERDARAQALSQARVREADDRRRAEEDAELRAQEEVRIARERAEAERRQIEEEARKAAEDSARRRAEEEARRRLGDETPPPRAAAPSAPGARPSGGYGERSSAPRPSGGYGDRSSAPRPSGGYGDRGPQAPRPAGGYGERSSAPRPAATGDRAPGPRPAPAGDNRAATFRPALGPARPKRVEARPATPPKRAPGTDDRRRGRLTVTNALEDDRERSLAAARRKLEKQKRQANGFNPTGEKITRDVVIPEAISVQDLANRMAERAVDVIRLLMRQGQMVKITDILDADTAQIVAEEMGHSVRRVSAADVEEGLFAAEDEDENKQSRPPVVTIMGHVDHGKTSLLDAIRNANVVAGEAGGITQHIGAYQVEQNGQTITFIDTPGHAAFTAMRARGAQATDIAILVVAADDGVMPQTIESINHAKAAGVPIIVAINKIDKPDANPDRVRNELLRYEIVVEAMGGDTQDVEVSALKKQNLDGLLEAILLQAEVLDLRANPEREAEGIVIEAKLDKGRGPVGTVLVQRGTLKVGDIVVAGSEWGRVRALVNDRSEQVKEAGPATPVEVLGLQGTPEAGDRFGTVENESRAREITEYRQRLKREKQVARQSGQRGSLADMMSQLQSTGQKTFPLVVKADVQGSAEAIVAAIDKIGTSEVTAQVVHSGVGAITESDVNLAAASNAAILGFNVRANAQARAAAEREGVEIRYYNIIYALTDDVKAAMSGMLSPERRESFLGNAEILQVFNITKVGKVAGCRVVEGRVERGAGVRLIRDGVVVHEGKLSTLKRFKDEVREVQMGQECGMAFENYQDMREGDIIECYRVEEVARTL